MTTTWGKNVGNVPTYTPTTFFWADPAHNPYAIDFGTHCVPMSSSMLNYQAGCSSTSDDNTKHKNCYNEALCQNYNQSNEILQRSGSDGQYHDLQVQVQLERVQLMNTVVGGLGMVMLIFYFRR
jgi:hypothetical protein